MSTEEETIPKSPTSEIKESESPKKSQDSSTSNSSNSQENQELLNNPYVQDLLLKIDVLKRGILKERKQNQELSDKLKKFEAELTSKIVRLEEEVISKTSQVKTLIQEKMELEQQLKAQKNPKKRPSKLLDILNINIDHNEKILGNLINKKPKTKKEEEIMDPNSVEAISSMANAEMRKLHEKISELKFQNETYFQKMNQTLEDAENKKMEYKEDIKKYTDKINLLEKEIELLQNEKNELNDRINMASSMTSQSIKETDHFRSLLNDYKKDREQANINLNSYIEKYNKLKEENSRVKKELLRHEENSRKMAKQLSELKNIMIKLNLRNQMFHVKKVGLLSNSEIDIFFGNSEYGNFIMRIDENGEQEVINIQDVESVEKISGSLNKVEIIYMKNGKKYNLVVIVNEFIVDQMLKAYKNFFSESMKRLNQID